LVLRVIRHRDAMDRANRLRITVGDSQQCGISAKPNDAQQGAANF
jgi:hypothetical protein